MGEILFNELPEYAQVFDVGIIPFIVNDLTIAANPLKLLEYMALGIPVVTAPTFLKLTGLRNIILLQNLKKSLLI